MGRISIFRQFQLGSGFLACGLFFCGCDTVGAGGRKDGQIQVQMQDRSGNSAGSLQLAEIAGGVKITGQITGLTPGEHGFHIHQNAVCQGPTFESAGGHFNPTQKMHGQMNPGGKHIGDLGNLKAGANGVAEVDVVAEQATLSAGEGTLLKNGGTSILVHSGVDDLKTDPAGNSGERVACGVIQTTTPATSSK
jgi:Cu-Zn family superoxide dismutase